MKRKLFMKKSQSRAGSGFARVMTMLTLTLTMLCVQSANALTLTCLRGSGFGEDEGCQYLFDGTEDTKWGTYDGSYGNPVYAVAKATMPIAPTTYSLKIANDTYDSPGRNWKSWRIFGGNFASDADAVYDAEGWVLIDQKVDQQMTTDQFAEVQFDLSKPDGKFYSYFMIVVDAICSNTNWDEYTQMDEFWFRDFKIDSSEALFSVSLKEGTEDATNWTIPEEAAEGATVTATYTGKLKVKSVKAVKAAPATVPVTAITLNKTETSIKVGSTETLSVTAVAPDNATDKTYTWKTSDESKATVDQDGKVTAVAAGTVTIYAEANDGSGVKGNCSVTVTPATITVTINQSDWGDWDTSITKDGVTVSASMIDPHDGNLMEGGTFSTTLGNFTKIVVTTYRCYASGTGWSGGTWTGTPASTVSFSGNFMGRGRTQTTIVCTIVPKN